MTKKHKKLFDQIYDFQSLLSAFYKVRKGKRQSKPVVKFELDLEDNLVNLESSLKNQEYEVGRYYQFKVYEPKERLISTLPVRDRVVQHAIHSVLYPIYDRMFIDDSFACRMGKGTHAGANRVTQYLRQIGRQAERIYCLKCDIHWYFYSIDRWILKRIIRRKISCTKTLWLLDAIIDSSPGDKGIPLGNLTSQLFANIYLNELDNFAKHQLGQRHYIRYMDDFVFLSSNKEELHRIRQEIELFLEQRLGLKLNHKTQLFPVNSRPVDFLGYRIYIAHKLLRNDSKKRFKKKLRRFAAMYKKSQIDWKTIEASINSWIGHCSHADTYLLRKHIFSGIRFFKQ